MPQAWVRCLRFAPWTLLAAALLAVLATAGAPAEQAAAPQSADAGRLDVGAQHSCALVTTSAVRCWGAGSGGQLGTGTTTTIGDDESPGAVAPVDLGTGRSARALAAGAFHSCALLDDGSVRCWGFGADGQLGYGSNTNTIGDDETPGSMPPVDLGAGRTAIAITAGTGHTCALLDDRSVRCWGFGANGRLGYGNTEMVASPGSVPPVDLGRGRTATAISAGSGHTCALLDDGSVRCWGFGANGRLGYANTNTIGDDETPGSMPPVDLGAGRTATAITTGEVHSCAVLDNGGVRCWGYGLYGTLGYGNRDNIGDNEAPGEVAPVFLGEGRPAVAISAGDLHTCVVLDAGQVRCWGYGGNGRLGYGNERNIGDDELPTSAGAVDVGAGRAARAISAGALHTCARLDDGSVRCWGYASDGRLGVCTATDVGDDERPSAVPPLDLEGPGTSCGAAGGGGAAPPPSGGGGQPPAGAAPAVPTAPPGAEMSAETLRARAWRRCLASVRRQPRRRRARARRACLARHGRTPGRVTALSWRPRSRGSIVLSFAVAGTAGASPPPARTYLVKQSLRPIRSTRDFGRAKSLCGGTCRFAVNEVGARVSLTVTGLRPRRTYHYAIAAYDNVTRRLGPRSTTLRVSTR